MQEGYVASDGSRIVRRNENGNLLMWYYPKSGRFGVYLYERPPKDWDEQFLLFSIRAQQEDANEIFDAVLNLLV